MKKNLAQDDKHQMLFADYYRDLKRVQLGEELQHLQLQKALYKKFKSSNK